MTQRICSQCHDETKEAKRVYAFLLETASPNYSLCEDCYVRIFGPRPTKEEAEKYNEIKRKSLARAKEILAED